MGAKHARAREVEAVWYAYTVVADGEDDDVVRLRDKIDFNPASSLIWKGMLQRVRDQFINDKIPQGIAMLIGRRASTPVNETKMSPRSDP